MIEIENVQTIEKALINYTIESEEHRVINGEGLLLMPALIDPHVHFRTPGQEHKENWTSASQAAITGGVTTVFDMPNNSPSCISKQRLLEKRKLIDSQLKIPLRYGLYLGADQNHLDQIASTKEQIVGLKIYMGSSTGDLLMNDLKSLEKAFKIAAQEDVLVAVHAEDEELIQKRKAKCKSALHPKSHSEIRNAEVAVRALKGALELSAKYGTRLYVAHVSTKEELDLIRQAKKRGLSVYAEATPHHLFLTTKAYENLGTLALVNPPLRDTTEPLWEGIRDGTIDTIGTDHAPHLLSEKTLPYGSAPSGFPSIELYLALLLDAHLKGKIALERIVELTHKRPKEIFRWPDNTDVVLVNLEKTKRIDNEHLKTRAKWSPYNGMTLKGWPCYTILRGKVYELT